MIKNFFKNIKENYLKEGSFASNVKILVTGTTISQLIPILVSPVLLRLYVPADYGLYAIYLSISSFLITIATGCYECAIVLPKKDEDSVNLSILSMIVAVGVSFLILLIVFIFGKNIANFFNEPKIYPWLFLVPVSVLFAGIYNTFNYWANRKKNYRLLTRTRISQSISTSATQITLGAFKFNNAGLIIGNLLGQFIATGYIVYKNFNTKSFNLKCVNKNRIIENAKAYSKFPKFHAINYLSIGFRGNGTIFFILSFLNSSVLGLYAFAMKSLQIPLNLISLSIYKVFYQKIADTYNKGENIWLLQRRLMIRLIFLVLPAFLFIIFFAPDVFALIFGEKWREAGTYSRYLILWLSVDFVATPLSVIPLVLGKQKTFMFIGVGYNILMPFVIFIALFIGSTINIALMSLSIVGSLYLVFEIIWFMSISKKVSRHHSANI